MASSVPILEVRGLTTVFRQGDATFRAVDDASFLLGRGEVMGLVGESGSGKSTLGYSIMRLIDQPGIISAGEVLLNGKDILRLPESGMRDLRGTRISMIFQDPMTSLHPMLRIGDQMVDAIVAHRAMPRRDAVARCRDMLGRVGIPAPEERLQSYPHQLSGGMRQRVAIAIAMLNDPDVIIADEPTTGLDVTIQAQILSEVQGLVAERGLGLVWITHDLAVVATLADRIAVMYAGAIVETGTVDEVIDSPAHPYTVALLGALPAQNRDRPRLAQIPGSYSVRDVGSGCRFAPRCSYRVAACDVYPPLLAAADGGGHAVRCIRKTTPQGMPS
ncbi:MAG TPA: ABC transporter ATP-binding protein [Paenirhodobacter sp.]